MPRQRWNNRNLAEVVGRGNGVRITSDSTMQARGTTGAPGEKKFWRIKPVPAPRQVPRDKFKPSDAVERYRAFRDECNLKNVWHPKPGDRVVFFMPIPKSRTSEGLSGMPHTQVPDVDNLLKALLDACYSDDSHIWAITAFKVWHPTGGIYIERNFPIEVPFLPREAIL